VISQYGRLLEKSGRPDEALQVYQRAVQAGPNDSMALARLGNFYGQHHNFQQARECLEKAVANTPARAPVAFRVQIRLQLGDCLQALGDRVAAQVQYQEGARLDPQLSVVHQRRRLDP
jgi:tetratricopeptide (TPR) repeat protein